MSLHNDARPADADGLALEAWAEGYMLGALVIMAVITLANMRPKVLLHKLIFVEVRLPNTESGSTDQQQLVFGMFQGVSIFFKPPAYGWYIAAGGVLLNTSWSMHNLIAWMKNRPFLSRRVSTIYLCTVIAVQPYWILEMVAAFLFFNDYSDLFIHTRPWEALFRDPWWIFTCASLVYNIKSRYEFSIIELIRVSPRLAIMLGSMFLSIVFIICDVLSVTHVIMNDSPDGINPFWKLAFVFKCLTDTIILDDFKTALDKLKEHHFAKMTSVPQHTNRPRTNMSQCTSIELIDKCDAQHHEVAPGNIVLERSVEITEGPRTSMDDEKGLTNRSSM